MFDQLYCIFIVDECVVFELLVLVEFGFVGGVLFEIECIGNCLLFVKLIKQMLDEYGVQFCFGVDVVVICVDSGCVVVEFVLLGNWCVVQVCEVDVIFVDVIVVVVGVGSFLLFEWFGWCLLLYLVCVYMFIVLVVYEEYLLYFCVVDLIKWILIMCIYQWLCVGGVVVLQSVVDIVKLFVELLFEVVFVLFGQVVYDWVFGVVKIFVVLLW